MSVEFLDATRREPLQTALADLLPSAWEWTEPDGHICFDGGTTAFLAPGMTQELERQLDDLLQSFDPGYAVVWAHEV